jgi:hypothetical protein
MRPSVPNEGNASDEGDGLTTRMAMYPEDTVTEEHDRLRRRTNELSKAIQALSGSARRFDRAEHEALAADLRQHNEDLRAHRARRTQAHPIRRL